MLYFLEEQILPGSPIHTDFLSSYATLRANFNYFTLYLSRNLVGQDFVQTNWIEGIFGAMKKMMRK